MRVPSERRAGGEAVYNVFLVEDHPAVRRALCQLVEGEPDLRVIGEAESAEAALEALTSLAPDLVLVDLSLPGMSGLELIGVLGRSRPGLRCLVVTGHVDALYQASALRVGAVGFVAKDEPDMVLAAVYAALAD